MIKQIKFVPKRGKGRPKKSVLEDKNLTKTFLTLAILKEGYASKIREKVTTISDPSFFSIRSISKQLEKMKKAGFLKKRKKRGRLQFNKKVYETDWRRLLKEIFKEHMVLKIQIYQFFYTKKIMLSEDIKKYNPKDSKILSLSDLKFYYDYITRTLDFMNRNDCIIPEDEEAKKTMDEEADIFLKGLLDEGLIVKILKVYFVKCWRTLKATEDYEGIVLKDLITNFILNFEIDDKIINKTSKLCKKYPFTAAFMYNLNFVAKAVKELYLKPLAELTVYQVLKSENLIGKGQYKNGRSIGKFEIRFLGGLYIPHSLEIQELKKDS